MLGALLHRPGRLLLIGLTLLALGELFRSAGWIEAWRGLAPTNLGRYTSRGLDSLTTRWYPGGQVPPYNN
jgi:hypothetical protein